MPFSLRYSADFADIFEVRGMHRPNKGRRLEDHVEKDQVLLSYEGLDNTIRQTCIRFDPVPKTILPSELQFEVHLQPSQKAVFHLSISCDPDAERDSVGYSSAMISARGEQKTASETFPRIYSSNSRFTDWIKRSAADVQMMTIGNPETNYPYAGVPWFSTVFGRDGIIAALQMLWLSPEIAKGVLEYLAATQAKDLIQQLKLIPARSCTRRVVERWLLWAKFPSGAITGV